jgi:hypothetical protein
MAEIRVESQKSPHKRLKLWNASEEFRLIAHQCEGSGDLEPIFGQIAELLMRRMALCVGSSWYRLAELEFYYTSPLHPDPFSHRHPIQLSTAKWYFHRASHRIDSKYKNGSYKDLDITIGSNSVHGGILIRSLMGFRDNQRVLIEGPCNVVNVLLKESNVESIEELVNAKLEGDLCACDSNYLALRNVERMEPSIRQGLLFQDHMIIRQGLRVGLTLKERNHDLHRLREIFITKPYRYSICAQELKKSKVTFVLHQLLLDSSRYGVSWKNSISQEETVARCCSLFRVKKSVIIRWMEQLTQGQRDETPNCTVFGRMIGYCIATDSQK